uniref:Hexosyltransferase n=1 Tax=Rhizophora mucronata TaxID=61149 RepID=A0A2P2KKD2_RHIMU
MIQTWIFEFWSWFLFCIFLWMRYPLFHKSHCQAVQTLWYRLCSYQACKSSILLGLGQQFMHCKYSIFQLLDLNLVIITLLCFCYHQTGIFHSFLHLLLKLPQYILIQRTLHFKQCGFIIWLC